jgi:hypothetical protein
MGNGFVSLTISCMKVYINRTGEVARAIDESEVMRTYTKIADDHKDTEIFDSMSNKQDE